MGEVRDHVKEFRATFGIASEASPKVPSEEVVRRDLRLIAEEFFELLEAAGLHSDGARIAVADKIDNGMLLVNIVEVADALADLDYVVEGMRQSFGIDGGPIAAEVQRSNMTKQIATYAAGAKIQKGPLYSPPDIHACLRAQGWNK